MWLNGAEVEAQAGGMFDVENPATGETLTRVAEGRAEDIDMAVRSGQEVFASGEWSRADPRDRAAVMNKAAQLLAERVPETAELECLQTGRAIRYVSKRTSGQGATWFLSPPPPFPLCTSHVPFAVQRNASAAGSPSGVV